MHLPKYSKRGREHECKWCPATFHQKERLNSQMLEGKRLIKFYCNSCDQMLDFKSMGNVEKHLSVRKVRGGSRITCISPLSQNSVRSGGGPEEIRKHCLIKGLKKGREEMWKIYLDQERLLKLN